MENIIIVNYNMTEKIASLCVTDYMQATLLLILNCRGANYCARVDDFIYSVYDKLLVI